MAHSIAALIGDEHLIQRLAKRCGFSEPTGLSHGLSLIPWVDSVTNEDLETFRFSEDERNISLAPETRDRLIEASRDGRVLLIVTSYFGGMGGQGAVIFEDGSLTHGPHWADWGTINEALEILGVQATPEMDQFDILGLGRFRHTAGWVSSSAP